MAHDRITRIVDLTMRLCRAVRRLDTDGYSASKAVKAEAMELAKAQLTYRDVHTVELHTLIAKFVALHPPDKPNTPDRKKKAILAAIERYDVEERTVRDALSGRTVRKIRERWAAAK